MEKTRIVIADDHVVFRQGTIKMLEEEPDIEVVGEAGDGEEAVAKVEELSPEVAIIDIAMPGMDGIAATKRIKQARPNTCVLILSAYDDDQFIFRLLQAGAAGYLLKTVHAGELVAAIRAVREGESVLHPSIARKVLSRFVTSAPRSQARREPGGRLTEREVRLVGLMTRGLSNKEIASELGVSVRTVQGHLRQIFKKLGVSSRTEAVVYALKEGWVTLEEVPRKRSSAPLEVSDDAGAYEFASAPDAVA